MSFAISKQGEVVVVDVEGQLIVGNRQELKQKVLDELEKGEKKFLIDFSQIKVNLAHQLTNYLRINTRLQEGIRWEPVRKAWYLVRHDKASPGILVDSKLPKLLTEIACTQRQKRSAAISLGLLFRANTFR